jgi:hypothetical protein
MSLELGNYYQRSISSAQKRYLAAIKTLALVRKLAIPILQVNIAKKQVNVAGPCLVTDSESATPCKTPNPKQELPERRLPTTAPSVEAT